VNIPECCWNCTEFDKGSAVGHDAYPPGCALGVLLPTIKRSCKRQRPKPATTPSAPPVRKEQV